MMDVPCSSLLSIWNLSLTPLSLTMSVRLTHLIFSCKYLLCLTTITLLVPWGLYWCNSSSTTYPTLASLQQLEHASLSIISHPCSKALWDFPFHSVYPSYLIFKTFFNMTPANCVSSIWIHIKKIFFKSLKSKCILSSMAILAF